MKVNRGLIQVGNVSDLISDGASLKALPSGDRVPTHGSTPALFQQPSEMLTVQRVPGKAITYPDPIVFVLPGTLRVSGRQRFYRKSVSTSLEMSEEIYIIDLVQPRSTAGDARCRPVLRSSEVVL